MISLYKPTKKTTGLAISFRASDRDKSLFLNLIKQFSWNEAEKKGSFVENKDKPGFSTAIKLNQIEAAAIIDCIERVYPWSAFHNSPSKTTQINFGPSQDSSVFTLQVNQTDKQDTSQKSSYFIPITYAEARLIKEYLIHYLHKSFRSNGNTNNKDKNTNNSPVQQEQTPEKQPEQDNPLNDFQGTETSTTSQPIDW